MTLSFKKKLGLVSLVILATQLICNGAEAMVSEAPAPQNRKTDNRTEKSKSMGPDSEKKEENLFHKYKPLTRRELNDLFKKANEEDDLNAQNEVIDRVYISAITARNLNHFTVWKNNVERYYKDDRYALFALFLIVQEKELSSSINNLIERDTLFNNIITRAKEGNADAQFNLGLMYDIGCGVSQNDNSALDCYVLAASQGHSMAQLNLGQIYWKGSEVVKKDFKMAIELITLSANQGNRNAQCFLGANYLSGAIGGDSSENKKKGLEWYILAANQGDPHAQSCLGKSFKRGLEVDKDIKQAFYWLTLSRERDEETDNFLRSHVGFYPHDNDDEEASLKDIQNEFTRILTGKKLTCGEIPTSGLHYLVNKYYLKVISNRQGGFNPLALSDLGKKDEIIADKLATFLIALEDFQKKYDNKTPGFMVNATDTTDDVFDAHLPFLSTYLLDDCCYISFGEDNVTLGNKLMTCLQTVDELCGVIQDKAELYKIGLKQGLADLMNKQTYLQICKEDKNRADEYLKKSSKFLQQQKDYEKLKALYTNEILEIEEKDIPVVQEAAKKTKDLISRFSLRNKWFTDEYEVFQ